MAGDDTRGKVPHTISLANPEKGAREKALILNARKRRSERTKSFGRLSDALYSQYSALSLCTWRL